MELHSEAVQVADVEWAKVSVESVVQQGLVDAEIHRRQ